MPKCQSCSTTIQEGRYCQTCGQDEQIAGGWEAIEADQEEASE